MGEADAGAVLVAEKGIAIDAVVVTDGGRGRGDVATGVEETGRGRRRFGSRGRDDGFGRLTGVGQGRCLAVGRVGSAGTGQLEVDGLWEEAASPRMTESISLCPVALPSNVEMPSGRESLGMELFLMTAGSTYREQMKTVMMGGSDDGTGARVGQEDREEVRRRERNRAVW